jgi:hypothetical protein
MECQCLQETCEKGVARPNFEDSIGTKESQSSPPDVIVNFQECSGIHKALCLEDYHENFPEGQLVGLQYNESPYP